MRSILLIAVSLVFPFYLFAATETLKIDPVASHVHWTGSKVTGSKHNGIVKVSAGKVRLENGSIRDGEFVIDMTTIESIDLKDKTKDKAKLENHLKSDDFFGVRNYPNATFKITKVTAPSATKGYTHDIEGNLTIKGKTEALVIPSRIAITPTLATAEGTVEIDRTKFDVKFGSKKFFENLVGDRVINDKFIIDLKLVASK